MDWKKFGIELKKINDDLFIVSAKVDEPLTIELPTSGKMPNVVYDFRTNRERAGWFFLDTVQQDELTKLLRQYNLLDCKAFTVSVNNPFKQYTDQLAETLYAKNQAYGDSFSKSVDQFGTIAAVVRLEDKFNRLANLTNNPDISENDESVLDTVKDMDGYSVLLFKYLKEHE